jgi:hypothetical protein
MISCDLHFWRELLQISVKINWNFLAFPILFVASGDSSGFIWRNAPTTVNTQTLYSCSLVHRNISENLLLTASVYKKMDAVCPPEMLLPIYL